MKLKCRLWAWFCKTEREKVSSWFLPFHHNCVWFNLKLYFLDILLISCKIWYKMVFTVCWVGKAFDLWEMLLWLSLNVYIWRLLACRVADILYTCNNRVATNLENLEYSGISLNMENSGNSRGILCSLRENCNKQSIFSSSFKYLCKTAVDWINRIIRISGSSNTAQ